MFKKKTSINELFYLLSVFFVIQRKTNLFWKRKNYFFFSVYLITCECCYMCVYIFLCARNVSVQFFFRNNCDCKNYKLDPNMQGEYFKQTKCTHFLLYTLNMSEKRNLFILFLSFLKIYFFNTVESRLQKGLNIFIRCIISEFMYFCCCILHKKLYRSLNLILD